MTDAEYEHEKERIKASVDRWVRPLGLKWWHIDVGYCRESKEGEDGDPDDNTAHTAAIVSVDWQYLQAYVKFFIPNFVEMSDEKLENVVVHELAHILVSELRAVVKRNGTAKDMEEHKEHEERVVTCLANAFLWTKEEFELPAEKKDEQPAAGIESGAVRLH